MFGRVTSHLCFALLYNILSQKSSRAASLFRHTELKKYLLLHCREYTFAIDRGKKKHSEKKAVYIFFYCEMLKGGKLLKEKNIDS